jgi:1-deoxy-D-xylulose-5-phosphate synthase
LDEAQIIKAAEYHELLVTVEENAIAGGAGAGINELLAAHNLKPEIINLGLPDRFQEHASQAEQRKEAGVDATGILDAINSRLIRTDLPIGQAHICATPISQ